MFFVEKNTNPLLLIVTAFNYAASVAEHFLATYNGLAKVEACAEVNDCLGFTQIDVRYLDVSYANSNLIKMNVTNRFRIPFSENK